MTKLHLLPDSLFDVKTSDSLCESVTQNKLNDQVECENSAIRFFQPFRFTLGHSNASVQNVSLHNRQLSEHL